LKGKAIGVAPRAKEKAVGLQGISHQSAIRFKKESATSGAKAPAHFASLRHDSSHALIQSWMEIEFLPQSVPCHQRESNRRSFDFVSLWRDFAQDDNSVMIYTWSPG